MLQLHLSDQQVYCLLKCRLSSRFNVNHQEEWGYIFTQFFQGSSTDNDCSSASEASKPEENVKHWRKHELYKAQPIAQLVDNVWNKPSMDMNEMLVL